MSKVWDQDDEGLKAEINIMIILLAKNRCGLSKKYHGWPALYWIIDEVLKELES